MTTDDIQKTIKKIEDDLKENEQPETPVPKGVATQHFINQRPREMTPEEIEAVWQGIANPSENDEESSIDEAWERIRERWVESAQERYNELQSLASLPGLDLSTVVSYHQRLLSLRCNHNGYQIRCKQCMFRFRSNDVDSMNLAQLHSNRNQHHVSFIFDFHGMHYELNVLPEIPQWLERMNRWGVCIGVPFLIALGIRLFLGKLSWLDVGFTFIGVLVGSKLYRLWQKRKGD